MADIITGIAGNIGAGKSTVSRILRCNGYHVYDCDMEASRLMESSPLLREALVGILGDACYRSCGKLDRGYVASKIFSDDSLREKVNAVVHKAVMDDFIACAALRDGRVFVESAILHTSGLDRICDNIWIVDADEDVRVERAMRRSAMKEREVRERMEAQNKEMEALASERVVVIDNNDCSEVLPFVLRLLDSGAVSEKLEFALE